MTTKAGNDRALEVAMQYAGTGQQGTADGADEQSSAFYVSGADDHRLIRYRDALLSRGFRILGFWSHGDATAIVFAPKDPATAAGIWAKTP